MQNLVKSTFYKMNFRPNVESNLWLLLVDVIEL